MQFRMRVQHPRDRVSDDGKDDVVDRAPERLPDGLRVIDGNAHRLEPSSPSDRRVQREPGSDHLPVDQGSDRTTQVGCARERVARRVGKSAGTPGDVTGAAGAFPQAVEQEPTGLGRWRGHPPVGRQHGGFGAEVEEHGGDVDAGDAVGEGVVGLVDQADVFAPIHPLHEPELPERLLTVEDLDGEAFGQLQQLPSTSGSRQRGQPHVVGDVEALVVDPDRSPLTQRHRHDPLPEARDQLEA